MHDDDFLCSFERCTITPSEFNHAAHVRASYLYLSKLPFLEACIAMRDGLKRFASSIGKATLYHETITIAFMAIVKDRMARNPGGGWRRLLEDNPDLCDKRLLDRYFPDQLLNTSDARERLILVERIQIP